MFRLSKDTKAKLDEVAKTMDEKNLIFWVGHGNGGVQIWAVESRKKDILVYSTEVPLSKDRVFMRIDAFRKYLKQ